MNRKSLLTFLLGMTFASIILLFVFTARSKQTETEVKTIDSTEAVTLSQPEKTDTLVATKVSKQETPEKDIVDETGRRILTIKGCFYPIELIEGTAFIFPKDLGSFGMKLSKTSNSYVLEDTSTGTKIVNGNIIISNSNSSVSITGSNNGVVINGEVITNNHTSGKRNADRILKITVPKNFDLNLNGSGIFTVNSHATIKNLSADISGSGDITISDVDYVSSLDLSGSSSFVIKKNRAIGKIDIAGSVDLEIGACEEIESIETSGSTDITLPKNTLVLKQSTSGSSDITRK